MRSKKNKILYSAAALALVMQLLSVIQVYAEDCVGQTAICRRDSFCNSDGTCVKVTDEYRNANCDECADPSNPDSDNFKTAISLQSSCGDKFAESSHAVCSTPDGGCNGSGVGPCDTVVCDDAQS